MRSTPLPVGGGDMAIKRSIQSGMNVIELMIAVAIGALVLAGLNSVVSLGLKAQTEVRQRNENVFQARFAMERIISKARSVSPKLLTTPTAGTTGNWFSPVMYCRNSASQLIEKITYDISCAGTTAIVSNVSAFSALLPAGAGVIDEPVASLSIALTNNSIAQTVTLSSSVRLGGGTL